VLSRRDDYTLRKHADFKGFENPEPNQPCPCLTSSSAARGPTPRMSTPTIRSAPCKASSTRCAPSIGLPRTNNNRLDKTLTDYQAQAKRPFEHEARLKELLARQDQLNAALYLDKSDVQAAEATTEPEIETAALPSRTWSVTPGVQPNSLPARSPYRARKPSRDRGNGTESAMRPNKPTISASQFPFLVSGARRRCEDLQQVL